MRQVKSHLEVRPMGALALVGAFVVFMVVLQYFAWEAKE